MSAVIYKLGGSLLAKPDLRARLHEVVRSSPQALIVVGGGKVVDTVRGWDDTFGLVDEVAHRLAIEALGVTASLVAQLLETHTCATREQATDLWAIGRPAVLDVTQFLRLEEPTAVQVGAALLPASWDVTSDSIAAWVARRWPADELVLLKACELSTDDWRTAAERQLVDPTFPSLAATIPEVRWLNLNASR